MPVNEPVNEPENEPENERLKEMLVLIRLNKRISIDELSNKCNVGRETIKRDLNKLKSLNLIKRIGPAKGGHWKVTEK